MANIIPVASGKGGVGKSSLSVNTAIALAQLGKKTLLVDVDLGGSNLHTLLGLRNNHVGLGNFIYHQTENIEDLIQETGIPNLWFISGDCLLPGTPNMNYSVKRRLMKGLDALSADFVIMDLGAGSTTMTLDLFLMTYNAVLVTTPELTAVLNAYSFIKSAAYRFLTAQFKPRSQERNFIRDYVTNAEAGAGSSFAEVLQLMLRRYPTTMQTPIAELKKYRPQVIMNMGRETSDLDIARRLRSLTSNKLCIDMDFIGFVGKDERVSLAIAQRKPLILTEPDSTFSKQVRFVAEHICHNDYEINEKLDFDDIEALGESFILQNSTIQNADNMIEL